MTREKAKNIVKGIIDKVETPTVDMDWGFIVDEYEESLEMAINQGPVFDKIRAEIEQMDFDFGDFYDHTDTIIQMVLNAKRKVRNRWIEEMGGALGENNRPSEKIY